MISYFIQENLLSMDWAAGVWFLAGSEISSHYHIHICSGHTSVWRNHSKFCPHCECS